MKCQQSPTFPLWLDLSLEVTPHNPICSLGHAQGTGCAFNEGNTGSHHPEAKLFQKVQPERAGWVGQRF